MQKEEKAVEKKGVMMRLTPKIFTALLREASSETMKRGKQVTVPALCLEIITAWVEAKKK